MSVRYNNVKKAYKVKKSYGKFNFPFSPGYFYKGQLEKGYSVITH